VAGSELAFGAFTEADRAGGSRNKRISSKATKTANPRTMNPSMKESTYACFCTSRAVRSRARRLQQFRLTERPTHSHSPAIAPQSGQTPRSHAAQLNWNRAAPASEGQFERKLTRLPSKEPGKVAVFIDFLAEPLAETTDLFPSGIAAFRIKTWDFSRLRPRYRAQFET
jgi:hypothetical protein